MEAEQGSDLETLDKALSDQEPSHAARERDDISSVIARRAIRMLFQPIVDLETGGIVGYEALARGPIGTNLEGPNQLFAAAERCGSVGELDLLCRTQALICAAASNRRREFHLFVNGEPGYLPKDEHLEPYMVQASKAGPTVLELAERSIFSDPANLLHSVSEARRLGWGIAVDDVGKNPESLALLPLIDPDVIKLDLSIVQRRPDSNVGLTVNAVMRQVEQSNCVLLAEGIETEEHLMRARSLGARLGQGWLFGRPDDLRADTTHFVDWPGQLFRSGRSPRRHTCCFDVIENDRRVRRSTKEVLLALSLDFERQAMRQPDGAAVFGCFQRDVHLPPSTRRRWAELGESSCLAVALGHGVERHPARGVRGVPLAANDPMVHEWTVVIMSSHFTGAVIARDVGDTGPDHLRRFDYVVTYDRNTVQQAAHVLLSRVLPDARS